MQLRTKEIRREETENKPSDISPLNQTATKLTPVTGTESVSYKVAIVGRYAPTAPVGKILKDMGLRVEHHKYIKDLKAHHTDDLRLILYVMPMSRGELSSLHKNLKKDYRFKAVPCFAVTPDWLSSSTERELYGSGIRMIFEWPREKKTFSKLFSKVLTQGTEKVTHENEDVALTLAVQNRNALKFGKKTSHVFYTTYNGIVMLRGRVNSLEDKTDLVKYTKKIPGVRGVVDVSLEVDQSPLSGVKLRAQARACLKEIHGLDGRAIRISVKGSTIFLRGNVPSEMMHKSIIDKMKTIPGIKAINDNTVIAESLYCRDSALAQRASMIAKKASLTQSKTVTVKIVDGTATLIGRVKHAMDKAHLEKVVNSLAGVRQVENQLSVA